MDNQSCIFCRIVSKQAPASIIYENTSVMAFLDIRPLHIGHTLLIPKDHYADIFDISESLLGEIHAVSKRVSLAIRKAMDADGISIIQQNGKAAGQDIFHLHVHIVPRYEGKKLPGLSDLKEASRVDLDSTAERIKIHLNYIE